MTKERERERGRYSSVSMLSPRGCVGDDDIDGNQQEGKEEEQEEEDEKEKEEEKNH